ncbi:Lrp/AsnC family transcriptional regulator [Microbacterium sp. 2FI]|uniref:Lrp/AsnC family transcriptional regulator n=1 Tax=Microbacterium sp. 2FI TaxID=2502193 RepID=UPI0010F8BE9E|nr:Lrp/AsnC family transcriptional regulator [Microbacterium sp. 2FI]
MDDIDRAILAVLERDGRISNADLAEAVGLSPSPCLRRVRRLEDDGIITGYRAVIRPSAMDRGLRVIVGVRLSRHARDAVAAWESGVTRLPAVTACHHVTGSFDYLLQVDVKDLAAYERFHAEALAGLPELGAVTSFVVMKTLEP